MKNSQEQTNKGFALQGRDIRLVLDLFASRGMSRDQIISLGYFNSIPRANARLCKLVRHGFLNRFIHLARGTGSQSLYRAGMAAAKLIGSTFELDHKSVHLQLRRDNAPLHLPHTLKLVDLRILFSSQAKKCGLADFTWTPEYLCCHEYLVAQGAKWLKRIIKSDAVAVWKETTGPRICFLELDLGHVSSDKFSDKIKSYDRYLKDGAFEEAYPAKSFEVLTITTGQLRLSKLKKLCASNKFLFCTLKELEQIGAFQLNWQTPCGSVRLLRGEQ